MLSKCCCCVPLRNGSIVLAVLGILIGILIGIGSFAKSGGFGLHIIVAIFYLLAYGALLFGAIKYNDKAVLFNLVLTAILIVLGIVGASIVIATIQTLAPELDNNCAALAKKLAQEHITCDEMKSATIGTATGILIVTFLQIYFWVCNYSFYKELKGGSANPAYLAFR